MCKNQYKRVGTRFETQTVNKNKNIRVWLQEVYRTKEKAENKGQYLYYTLLNKC